MGLNGRDVWGHFAPMFHLVDAFAIYAITLVGGRHAILPTFTAQEALLMIGEHHVHCTCAQAFNHLHATQHLHIGLAPRLGIMHCSVCTDCWQCPCMRLYTPACKLHSAKCSIHTIATMVSACSIERRLQALVVQHAHTDTYYTAQSTCMTHVS